MDPKMPAAVLQQGTTAGQRRVVATMATPKQAPERQASAPLPSSWWGKVCPLEKQFAWYEKLPLAGGKAVVTRPRNLVSAMAQKLRTKGAEVLELPAIARGTGKGQKRGDGMPGTPGGVPVAGIYQPQRRGHLL